ncbi:MAG: hypothetical protein P4L75_02670 [Clostridia bacterium]|nr:hypothetical protein [Clostridia bacterium]
MMYSSYEPFKTYINKRFHYFLETPESWFRGIRESPGGDTVVLYNADGNLVRVLASTNVAGRQFFSDMISSPFKTDLVTESGLRGKISIGGSKSANGRVIAWFCAENGGILFHLVADAAAGFAVENKDSLINIAKSFGIEGAAVK